MNTHTNRFDPTAEWNRRRQSRYANTSRSGFIESAFNLLRATVHCDFLLFHYFVDWAESLRTKSPAKFCKLRRVEHGVQPSLHATITILSHRAPLTRPTRLVRIERRPEVKAKTPMTAPSAAVLDILIISEREVAMKTSEGLSNQEIADELAKTVCAVIFLQRMIYKKLQISNRSRLVALLGSNAA